MNFSVFLSCVSFAIVMPSLWPYLSSLNSSKPFFALVVALYSVGEAVGAVVFGWISGPSTRRTILSATALGVIGSILFVVAPLFATDAESHTGATVVLFARLFQGAWLGGAQAVYQVHLSKVLPDDQVTAATVSLNSYVCLGFVFGPCFGLIASSISPFSIGFGLQFNELTAPGYFVLFSCGVTAALFVFAFGEDEDHFPGLKSEDETALLLSPSLAHPMYCSSRPPTLIQSLIVCNIAFFVHSYGFALQETITTPIVLDFGWTVFDANLLFTVAGIVSFFAFIALAIVTTHISDRALASFSLLLSAVGFALLISTPTQRLAPPRFLVGFLTITVAFPVGRTTFVALYTKLLPQAWQGTGQGVILAVGAVARIMAPFWAVHALDMWLGGLIVFGVSAVLFVAAWIFVVTFYSSLEIEKSEDGKLLTAMPPNAISTNPSPPAPLRLVSLNSELSPPSYISISPPNTSITSPTPSPSLEFPGASSAGDVCSALESKATVSILCSPSLPRISSTSPSSRFLYFESQFLK